MRKQRGRHLHETHAAPHDAGGEAGKIAYDAAAQRDHDIATLEARGDNRFDHFAEIDVALGLLASRQNHRSRFDAACLQAAHEAIEMGCGNVGVGHHRGTNARQAGSDLCAGALNQARSDEDVVGAVSKADFDLHWVGHSALTFSSR